MNRRRFLKMAALAVPGCAALDMCLVEPKRLQVRHLDLVTNGRRRCTEPSLGGTQPIASVQQVVH